MIGQGARSLDCRKLFSTILIFTLFISPAISIGAALTVDVKNVEAVPFISEDGKTAYKDWTYRQFNKAFVINARTGDFTRWRGARYEEDAIDRALALCRQQAGSEKADGCFVYAVNDRVVWDGKVPESKKVVANEPVNTTSPETDQLNKSVQAKADEDRKQKELQSKVENNTQEAPKEATPPVPSIFDALRQLGNSLSQAGKDADKSGSSQDTKESFKQNINPQDCSRLHNAKNYQAAWIACSELDSQGDLMGTYGVSRMLWEGNGVEKDQELSITKLRQVANGDPKGPYQGIVVRARKELPEVESNLAAQNKQSVSEPFAAHPVITSKTQEKERQSPQPQKDTSQPENNPSSRCTGQRIRSTETSECETPEMLTYLQSSEHKNWMKVCLPTLTSAMCRKMSGFNYGFVKELKKNPTSENAKYMIGSPKRFQDVLAHYKSFELALKYMKVRGGLMDKAYVEALVAAAYAASIVESK